KKIGGYELGSTMSHNHSAAIGHFFFSQAFRTGITGLWATHPPLDERIRAIDPQWDGQFLELAEMKDGATERFAGNAAGGRASPEPTAAGALAAASTVAQPSAVPPLLPTN